VDNSGGTQSRAVIKVGRRILVYGKLPSLDLFDGGSLDGRGQSDSTLIRMIHLDVDGSRAGSGGAGRNNE
jgi:hypothetical protein